MTPEAKAIFDRCDEYVREALTKFDKSVPALPVAIRQMVASRIAELRASHGNALRDAYLTGVWETYMGREMPFGTPDWEAEIQAAVENRF